MSSKPTVYTPLNDQNDYYVIDSPPKIRRTTGRSLSDNRNFNDHIQQFNAYFEDRLLGKKTDQFNYSLNVSDERYIAAAVCVIKRLFKLDAEQGVQCKRKNDGVFTFQFKYYHECTCCFWIMNTRRTKYVDLDLSKGIGS